MFAGKTKELMLQDGDGPSQVVIRSLSWKTMKKAREAAGADQISGLRLMGGEIVAALNSNQLDEAAKQLAEAAKTPKTEEQLKKERYNTFSMEITLGAGIVSWSNPEKVTPDEIDKLDAMTAQKLHEEIVDFTLGPLEQKAASKG